MLPFEITEEELKIEQEVYVLNKYLVLIKKSPEESPSDNLDFWFDDLDEAMSFTKTAIEKSNLFLTIEIQIKKE